MDNNDRKAEEAKLAEHENDPPTPELREAKARPLDAGDYRNLWDAYGAAQRLFAREVGRVDEESRDKKDKKALGKRTIAIRKWFDELPKSKMEEAEAAAKKWNSEGARNKEKMHM